VRRLRRKADCTAGLALPEVPAFVTRLLVLEQALIAARDIGCHRASEADEAGDTYLPHDQYLSCGRTA
jgi:hypothetical protein